MLPNVGADSQSAVAMEGRDLRMEVRTGNDQK